MNYNITSEMRCFFNKRTKMHIDYVIEYGKKINIDFSDHDQDKYSPELIDAYTILTWQKNHKDFQLPDDIKLSVKKAIDIHLQNNKHHPQAWERIEDMDELHIKEMCCDLCAMSKEFNDNPKVFFNNNLAKKYSFTKKQKQLITKTMNILCPEDIQQRTKSIQR